MFSSSSKPILEDAEKVTTGEKKWKNREGGGCLTMYEGDRVLAHVCCKFPKIYVVSAVGVWF